MNIYDRIKIIAQDNNTNIKTIEKELGIGNGTIKGWITSSPRCDKIISIANKYDVSIEWILLGNQPNTNKIELTEEEQDLLNYFRRLPEKKQIRFLGRIEAEIENLKEAEEYKQETKSSALKSG